MNISNRRELLQHMGAGALALIPAMMSKQGQAFPPRGDQPKVPQHPPMSIRHTPHHAGPPLPIHHHTHHHHKPAHHSHHRKHHPHNKPHHHAHNLRALHTLNTPGNRHDLALTMWGEARGYGELGMRCIGHVILNRVTAGLPAFGDGVHGVCHKHKQFSCWNAGDPNRLRMEKLPHMDASNPDWIAWMTADRLAGQLLAGADKDNTGGATYYHAENMIPYWINDMIPVGVMFGHIFYKPKKYHKHHNHHHQGHHHIRHGSHVDHHHRIKMGSHISHH